MYLSDSKECGLRKPHKSSTGNFEHPVHEEFVYQTLSCWVKIFAEIDIKLGFINRGLSHTNLGNLRNCYNNY